MNDRFVCAFIGICNTHTHTHRYAEERKKDEMTINMAMVLLM